MFKLYAPYYKEKDNHGGESDLSLDVNEKEIYSFLVGKSMETALLLGNQIKIDYEQKSKPISSDNVAAIIKGTEKTRRIYCTFCTSRPHWNARW
jgi:hypothetical protein